MKDKIVVVIDDQSEVLMRIKNMLEMTKEYECLIFTDPDKAKNIIESFVVHAVIADIYFNHDERINGLQFAKEIRDAGYKGKIAIMTGYLPDKMPAIYQGVYDILLEKPFKIMELKKWLDSF